MVPGPETAIKRRKLAVTVELATFGVRIRAAIASAMVFRGIRVHVGALAAYGALAVGLSWPLPRYLGTHLTGSPSGDTGVYVWNLWVFRHELVEHHRLPLTTSKMFALTGDADLSQHNYTVLSNLLGVPLLDLFDLVTTFNLIYLVQTATAGYALFLLARRVTGRSFEAWVSGAVFAAAPALQARSLAHHSLLWVAPLPLFVVAWQTSIERRQLRWAVAAGVCAALAAFGDPYYGVYTALMAGVLLVPHLVRVKTAEREPPPAERPARRLARLAIDAALVVFALLAGWIAVGHGTTVQVAGQAVHLRSLYTPVLVLTALALVRLALALRLRAERPSSEARRPAILCAVVTGGTAAVVLSPLLYAAARRLADGTFEVPDIYWRSSPPGVDLLSFVLPNPLHPWFGAPFARWLGARAPVGESFVEVTASLSLAATLVIAWTLLARRRRLPRLWLAFTLVFVLLALGPFVHLAGANLYVPGPWAFLRYVPIVGLARSPSRFALVVAMGHAVLFAAAFTAMRDHLGRRPSWRAGVTVAVCLGLLAELLPIPRTLFSASVPSIYATIAADPDEHHVVLELPVGLRDGTSSIGDQSAQSQFYQAFHGKPILGGYLSRVSKRRKARYRAMAVMDALFTLSEGRPLDPGRRDWILTMGRRFVHDARLHYVVVDTSRASPELRAFAVELFDLVKLGEAQGLELYVPRAVAAPAPPPSR